jgi:hypothetical protein
MLEQVLRETLLPALPVCNEASGRPPSQGKVYCPTT